MQSQYHTSCSARLRRWYLDATALHYHYKIPSKEINRLKIKAKKENLSLITTEKDFFRLNKLERKNIKFLKIKLEIKDIKNLKKILITKL